MTNFTFTKFNAITVTISLKAEKAFTKAFTNIPAVINEQNRPTYNYLHS
jgi:hypothetical protein